LQAEKDETADGTTCIFDIWHNNVTKKEFEMPIKTMEELEAAKPNEAEATASAATSTGNTKTLWLHRKGAAPSGVELCLICDD